jgi:hypothetical protein
VIAEQLHGLVRSLAVVVGSQDKGGYQVFYTIRIKGHLDPSWSEWFAGLTITHDPEGETVLAGPVRDQAALFGILIKLRDLGLVLIAVNRVEQWHS